MADTYYDSDLTGEQLDEAFGKLRKLDESVAAAAQSASDAEYWAKQAAESASFDPASYYTKTETDARITANAPMYTALYRMDDWADADESAQANGYMYRQTVTLTPDDPNSPAVTADSKFLPQIGTPKTGVAETDDILKEALNIIADGVTTTGAGTVITLVREKPTTDIPVVWTLRTGV